MPSCQTRKSAVEQGPVKIQQRVKLHLTLQTDGLDDLTDTDETVPSLDDFQSDPLVGAALTAINRTRRARAVWPPLPMTLPRSSGWTLTW